MNQYSILKNTKKSLTTVMAIIMVSALSPVKVKAQADAGVVRSIEGVWMVTVSPRNCITGNPIPGSAFEGLFTFHKGGTMSAWLQNSLIVVTRSPSHGLWQRDFGSVAIAAQEFESVSGSRRRSSFPEAVRGSAAT